MQCVHRVRSEAGEAVKIRRLYSEVASIKMEAMSLACPAFSLPSPHSPSAGLTAIPPPSHLCIAQADEHAFAPDLCLDSFAGLVSVGAGGMWMACELTVSAAPSLPKRKPNCPVSHTMAPQPPLVRQSWACTLPPPLLPLLYSSIGRGAGFAYTRGHPSAW